MNRRDALISALASGTPVDWDLVDGPAWEATEYERSKVRRTHWTQRWAGAGWAAALTLAGVQVMLVLFHAGTTLGLPGGSEPGWLLLANILVFGASGGVLMFGGRQDLRAQALGATFMLIAAAFALPLSLREGVSPSSWLGIVRLIPVDALLATGLWLFVWTFPRAPRGVVARRIGVAFLTVSIVVGLVLLLVNTLLLIRAGAGVAPVGELTGFERLSSSWYWPLVFAAAAPAIPYLLWKSRQEPREERRLVRGFVAGLAVGVLPITVAVLASIGIPAMGRRPWVDLAGVVIYAALASMVPTTMRAVWIDEIMNVRLAVGRSVQHRVAQLVVWVCAIGPLAYLAVGLYTHRDQTLAQYLGTRGALGLFVPLVVGFTALTFRYQMMQGVDQWFRRGSPDSTESLARLDRGLKTARTIRQVATTLAEEVSCALRVTSPVVLVAESQSQMFVPMVGSASPLPADAVILDVLRSASPGTPVPVGPSSPIVRLLPRDERDWLATEGVHALTPLTGATGDLIGAVAIGRSEHGLPYGERDRALMSSMCGQAALQLENQWLRERTNAAVVRDGSTDGYGTLDWQNEPAQCCPRCSRVWSPATAACACGSAVQAAALPALVSGKFQLERQVGSGGMGVVYLATDLTLGRQVALKTLPRVSEDLAARLQREARAMATVLHPNLALIYGAEQWRGNPILIVEYLEGGTVLDGLRRGPFALEETLGLGIVLADVLDRLHGTGVLHRDVKPSNIGYTASGVPKLLDLGLAAAFDAAEATVGNSPAVEAERPVVPSIQGTEQETVSHSGQLLGTLRYMSPEALAGAAPAPSFDLWGLALVLYEVLAGSHPLADKTGDAVARSIRRAQFPDVRDRCPDCPASVAAFFNDALSAFPERRPQTAAEFRRQLQALRAASSIS